jgi:membrane-associated phospholipid phosphatase
MRFEQNLNFIGWNQRLHSSSLFRRWWRFWSNYSVIFFAAAAFGLSRQPNSYKMLILSAISFLAARGLVTTLINYGFQRQRPYQKYKLTVYTSRFFSYQTIIPNSFPSRHATAFASVAGVVLMHNPLVGIALLSVTLMTGLGRIVLGYHYPTDIIGGMVLGVLIGILVVYAGAYIPFTL